MVKVINFLIGILLLPVCLAATASLYTETSNIGLITIYKIYFMIGVGLYLIMHLFFFVPDKLYEAQQNMINKFLSGISGGKLKTSGILPQLIPLYMVMISLIYWGLSFFFSDINELTGLMVLLIGLTLTFHIVLTAQTLRSKEGSVFASSYLSLITIIFIVNITIAAFVLSFLYVEVSMEDYFVQTYRTAKDVYLAVFNRLFG